MKVLYLQYALRFFSPCACACFDHERKDCDFDGGLIGVKEMCAKRVACSDSKAKPSSVVESRWWACAWRDPGVMAVPALWSIIPRRVIGPH